MSNIKTTFTGDTRSLQRAIDQMATKQDAFEKRIIASNKRAADSSKRSWQSAMAQIKASQDSLGATIGKFSAIFAGAFSVTEAVRFADTFTSLQAKLINAKVASQDMVAVQQKLFNAANANGTEVVALADLYGNLSMSAKSVGLSQSEMMLATEGVAAAMRLSGATTAQSSATILQLGQALAGGTVRAEEYNSMLENSPALVRAVADSSVRWGGDLGKLRKEINDGKVSSEAWAKAIVSASNKLKTDAANAPLTVAASMQILENNIVQWIGKADQSLGVTDKLSWAIKTLGANLDTAGSIAAVVAAALVARMIPALLATGTAAGGSAVKLLAFQVAMQRSMTGSSVAMAGAAVGAAGLRTALGTLSAFMGGPLGIAITAVVGGIMLLNARQAELHRRATELPASFNTTTTAIDAYKAAQVEAATKTGEASKKAWEHVTALKAEADAMLLVSKQEAQRKIDKANEARGQADRLIVRNNQRQQSSATRMGNNGTWAMDSGLNAQTQSAIDRARQLAAEGRQAAIAYDRAREQMTAPAAPAAPPSLGAGAGSGRGSGSSAPDAKTVTSNSLQAIQTAEDTLRQAMAGLATTTSERLKYQLEGIRIDAQRQRDQLATQMTEGQITRASAETAKTSIDAAEAAQIALAKREAQAETEAKLAALADARLQSDQQVSALQEAYLSDLASQAATIKERQAFESQALALRQTAEKDAHEAQLAMTALEWRKVGMAEAEIARRQTAARGAFDQQQNSERSAQQADFKNGSPVGKYISDLQDLDLAFENVKANGLKSLEDGLVDVMTGAGDLKSVFGDLAKSIIADLVRISIQQTIMKPLLNWLGGGSSPSSGGGGGIISAFASIFSKVGRNASGTDSWRGGLSLVGESGPELVSMPKGSQVASNSLLRNALSAPSRTRSAPPVVNLTTVVHANDSVIYSQIQDQIRQANMQAVQAARQLAFNDGQQRARNRLR